MGIPLSLSTLSHACCAGETTFRHCWSVRLCFLRPALADDRTQFRAAVRLVVPSFWPGGEPMVIGPHVANSRPYAVIEDVSPPGENLPPRSRPRYGRNLTSAMFLTPGADPVPFVQPGSTR